MSSWCGRTRGVLCDICGQWSYSLTVHQARAHGIPGKGSKIERNRLWREKQKQLELGDAGVVAAARLETE